MRKYSKRIIAMISIAAAVAAAVLISIRVYSNSPAGRTQRQLALGTTYLQELKYDEAIASFKEALKISPDSSKALDDLTQAYITYADGSTGTDDYKAGMAVLKDGIKYLQGLSNSSDQQTAPDADALTSAIKQMQAKLDELKDKQNKKEEEERREAQRKKDEKVIKGLEKLAKTYRTNPKYQLSDEGMEKWDSIKDFIDRNGKKTDTDTRYVDPEKHYGVYYTEIPDPYDTNETIRGIYLYIGEFDGTLRTGNAFWVEIIDSSKEGADYYYADCNWENDMPNGKAQIHIYTSDETSSFDSVHKCTLVNGLFDGELQESKRDITWKLQYSKGTVHVLETTDDDEGYIYTVSEYGSDGEYRYAMDEVQKDAKHGLGGFAEMDW